MEKYYALIGAGVIFLIALLAFWITALIFKPKNSFWLFGTRNLRWGAKEMIKMYSANEVSYFSKKRFHEGIAFFVMQYGLIHWLCLNITSCGWMGISAWASVEGLICGYTLNQTQKEKLAQ